MSATSALIQRCGAGQLGAVRGENLHYNTTYSGRGGFEMLDTNRCFSRFTDRAERIDSQEIAETFVSVGPLLDVLESTNNQIIYGRRGTGKTHALRYFVGRRATVGDVAVYIDCQNIGSNQSIYDDKSLPIGERSTRLLIDVCAALHAGLLDAFTAPQSKWDISAAAPLLDLFVQAISEVRVVGVVETENSVQAAKSTKNATSAEAQFDARPSLKFGASNESNNSESVNSKIAEKGVESVWIDFNYLNQRVRAISDFVKPKRIWILIDEWSTIPPDLQPFLADLLRRTLFTSHNISVKIAAIEHRSVFKIDRTDSSYIGFELGADIHPAINLDDYLVFDNDEGRATEFFRTLISNHSANISKALEIDLGPANAVIGAAFTQSNVFTEFVRASEGVPRDAMHILALAAQKANEVAISMPILRSAALVFFQQDKYSAIQSNPANRDLLDWIRDQVIGTRRTRAFMLPVNVKDETIDRLFDRRALHIKSRSMSSAHRAGERFVVYKLDYGCYADLINTNKSTTGMLLDGSDEVFVDFDVPDDDGRSYRRAVLDLSEFYEARDAAEKGQQLSG
jgi:hypothetical protein